MAAKDLVIPIVFPEYKIMVETPRATYDLPGPLPVITIPKMKHKLPYLGHAGVLFISGSSGVTKYYEYGRYDKAAKGIVRKQDIPDVTMKNGQPTHRSLANVLAKISLLSGQSGPIEAAYIELPAGSYGKMLAYVTKRMGYNKDPKRREYDLDDYSCLHFARSTAAEGGAKMPDVFDPRPVGYIGDVRDEFPDLDFRRPDSLSIEGISLP